MGLVPGLLNPDFVSKVTAATLEIQSDAHPIARAAFRDLPWNLFGSFAASRSQVTVRTPFLDNDLVEVAFRVPGTLRKSAQPALRLIENNYPALSRIPTDRRIEDRTTRFPKNLRRIFFESIFKLDYLYNEGMLPWLSPVDATLARVNSRLYLFGHHKFLHYRSWLSRELAGFLREAMADTRIQESRFWDRAFLRNIVADHTAGRKNYLREIDAILTLAGVERLLFTNHRKATAAAGEVKSRSMAELTHSSQG
jgi:asparagine synthase (glutamine-hydrolysing)